MVDIVTPTDKRQCKRRFRYHREGQWRSCELRDELIRRMGIEDQFKCGADCDHCPYADKPRPKCEADKTAWFYYLLKIGIIPKGELRTPYTGWSVEDEVHTGGGKQQIWTELQAIQIFANVPALLSARKGRV